MRYPSWFLATHSMSYTRPHRDSAGLCTHITTVHGQKVWFFLRWIKGYDPTPADWRRRNELMASGDVCQIEYRTTPPWITRDGKLDLLQCEKHWEACQRDRVAQWEAVLLSSNRVL